MLENGEHPRDQPFSCLLFDTRKCSTGTKLLWHREQNSQNRLISRTARKYHRRDTDVERRAAEMAGRKRAARENAELKSVDGDIQRVACRDETAGRNKRIHWQGSRFRLEFFIFRTDWRKGKRGRVQPVSLYRAWIITRPEEHVGRLVVNSVCQSQIAAPLRPDSKRLVSVILPRVIEALDFSQPLLREVIIWRIEFTWRSNILRSLYRSIN